MASITIWNLDENVMTRLRVRAAKNHRSMEEEARFILHEGVGHKSNSQNLVDIIQSHFGPLDGIDLQMPPREPARETPSFD